MKLKNSALQELHDSLVRILEALPTITNNLKITLGQSNILKLTDDELAIATDKGWVIA